MKKLIKILGTAALVATTATTFDVPAERTHPPPLLWPHDLPRKYCRHSCGTTGLVAGGVAGAVVGSQ